MVAAIIDIVVGATETSSKTDKLFVYREAELVLSWEEFNVVTRLLLINLA